MLLNLKCLLQRSFLLYLLVLLILPGISELRAQSPGDIVYRFEDGSIEKKSEMEFFGNPTIYPLSKLNVDSGIYLIDFKVSNAFIDPQTSKGVTFGLISVPAAGTLVDRDHNIGDLAGEYAYLQTGEIVTNGVISTFGSEINEGDAIRIIYNSVDSTLTYYLSKKNNPFDLQGNGPAFTGIAPDSGKVFQIAYSVLCFGLCKVSVISGFVSNPALQGGGIGSSGSVIPISPTQQATTADSIDLTVAAAFNGTGSASRGPYGKEFKFTQRFGLDPGVNTINVSTDYNNSGTATFTIHKYSKPQATNVSITGGLNQGDTLGVNYTYSDPNGDPESGTTFQWFRSDDNTGANRIEINGSTDSIYITGTDDEGKYISVEVTPAHSIGTGDTVESNYHGPVKNNCSTLNASISIDSPVSCNGGSDASITASASGGQAPYAYSWNGGGTGQTNTGLSAGTHTVTITDNNGCTASASVSLGEPSVLTGGEIK